MGNFYIFPETRDSNLDFGGFCSRVAPKLEALEFFFCEEHGGKNGGGGARRAPEK